MKPADLVFHVRMDSTCQHLIQRSYYSDKWSEMKIKTITYFEVNRVIKFSNENSFVLLNIIAIYEIADAIALLPFPN